MDQQRFSQFVLTLLLILPLWGCQSAIEKAARNTGYSAYELIGIEKRDLLKSRVSKARSEQKEASENFESALDRLKALTAFDGGNLERQYKSLQSAYDRSAEQAGHVRQSIEKVETVAADLYEEWEKEIAEIQTASLKSSSQQKLRDTKKKSDSLVAALKKSEKSMTPVLAKLKDQVLFLKHNLNAQAVGSLKGESVRIQGDIEKLLKEMNQSISEADRFIKEIETN
ncbi:MAG: DUF2959 domain-containing protein [Bdellovibrionaceae bacterium]|nr:DUF2959 domain-containing protein [Pseudobdellovibrionaceae bacterium]